jgi:hypothetical protein
MKNTTIAIITIVMTNFTGNSDQSILYYLIV